MLKDLWPNTTLTFWQPEVNRNDHLERILKSYVEDWYDLSYVDERLCHTCDVVMVEEQNLDDLLSYLISTPRRRPALAVLCSVLSKHSPVLVRDLEKRLGSAFEFVSLPCGPHKLARSLHIAIEKQARSRQRESVYSETNVAPSQRLSELTGRKSIDPASLIDGLSDLDLSTPGGVDNARVVQASETFAASQASHNAQMALHDPFTTLRTPRPHASEGDAFPFPSHTQQDSRIRQHGGRDLKSEGHDAADGPVPIIPASKTPRRQKSMLQPTDDRVDPHVLLVDDNKINLRLLETFLKSKRKYTRFTQAEDGQQAVDAVKSAAVPYDIIFMDISMPVLDGFGATRQIRAFEEANDAEPGAMIIALTGLASAKDQAEVFSSGCDIYMTKPVSFKEVGKLLDNWEKHRRLGANTSTSEQA
jgi:CheY-like chemotaxis protein